jgi:Protein of unknown function DUF262
MIRYQLRSVSLLSVVNDIRKGRWMPDAYFQRNLVWRDVHNRDFIETILKGFPFPQLFISRGEIDLERMETTSLIVDGQQRTNAIMQYVDNKFAVQGKYFRDLSDDTKSDFFKYEIGVIELDLDNKSPEVKEIFQRLNRTSNSLTTIEKLASEFGASEYMLVAKLLTDQLDLPEDQDDSDYKIDPLIPSSSFAWASSKSSSGYSEFVKKAEIFTPRETARKVPLFYALNIVSTVLTGHFNRNDQTLELLDTFKEEFPAKDQIVDAFEKSAFVLKSLSLDKHSMWFQKANFFTLFSEIASCIYSGGDVDPIASKELLLRFEVTLPDDYAYAAREGVNNKRERSLRAKYVASLLVSRDATK